MEGKEVSIEFWKWLARLGELRIGSDPFEWEGRVGSYLVGGGIESGCENYYSELDRATELGKCPTIDFRTDQEQSIQQSLMRSKMLRVHSPNQHSFSLTSYLLISFLPSSTLYFTEVWVWKFVPLSVCSLQNKPLLSRTLV